MSAVGNAWRANWSQIMVWMLVAFSVGTCVNFVLIGLTMRQQGQQSAAGRSARATQCKTRPVTIRKENWFHASGVTSEAERQLVLRALPSREECAALLKRP